MGSPQQRISPSKEPRSRQIRNPKTLENQTLPAFPFIQSVQIAHARPLRHCRSDGRVVIQPTCGVRTHLRRAQRSAAATPLATLYLRVGFSTVHHDAYPSANAKGSDTEKITSHPAFEPNAARVICSTGHP